MADSFGRKLGLRSIQINPATWGKLLREQEPAVESITTRTADLISLLETVPTGERSVRFKWPRGATGGLLTCAALVVGRAAVRSLARQHELTPPALAAALWALNISWIVAFFIYLGWMHSVLRFTKS